MPLSGPMHTWQVTCDECLTSGYLEDFTADVNTASRKVAIQALRQAGWTVTKDNRLYCNSEECQAARKASRR